MQGGITEKKCRSPDNSFVRPLAQARVHAVVVLSIVVLALLGRMPESQAGWLTCPPQVVMVAQNLVPNS